MPILDRRSDACDPNSAIVDLPCFAPCADATQAAWPPDRTARIASGRSSAWEPMWRGDEDSRVSTDGGSTTIRHPTIPLKAHESALAQAQDEAERATAERARVVAALAHDLMQPLLGVRLHLACALSDAPTEMIGTLRTAIASLLSAEHLVETLMESAALDVDGICVIQSTVDLQEIVNLVCEEASAVAWIRLLDLRYRAHRGLAVRTDPILVTRVIRNLVSNAVRYSERGKVLVGLRTRDGLPVVEVWDTGAGIEPGALAAYLAEGTLAKVPARGMGIGLQTVARLVDALGLTLDARSVPGRGTVFRLVFPEPASPEESARL